MTTPRVYRHAGSPAPHDHTAVADPDLAASSTGPVRVCRTCNERVAVTDVTGAILDRRPDAVVTTRQYDGGLHYEVRIPGRTIFPVRLSVDWDIEDPDALAEIMLRLGAAL
jgi:hypothetical protein